MSFQNIISNQTAAGIEVLFQENSIPVYNVVILKKNKNKLIIEKEVQKLTLLEEVKSVIGTKTPIVLSISGKGIIHKKIVQTETDLHLSQLLNNALPGAQLSDFCIQLSEVNTSHVFVSLIRNPLMDSILKDFTDKGLNQISDCFLAPFVLNNVLPYLEIKDTLKDQYVIAEHAICEIHSSSINESIINMEGEKVPRSLLIAFSSAFSYFTFSNQGLKNSHKLNELTEEHKAKQTFEKRAIVSLGIALLIVIVNFFVFSNYWTKNNELQASYTSNKAAVDQFDTLQKEYLFKKQFLEERGLQERSKTSFYADRLAETLPSSINWTSVKINPRKKVKGSENESYSFENKTIDINGNCKQSSDLNLWMKQIAQNSWINQVTLLNYTQGKKNDPGSFLLRLSLK
jgi:Tfp pilus assembly protein PilN